MNFIQLIDLFHFFNRKRIYFRYLSTFSRDSISIGSVLLSQVGRLWMAFQLNFFNKVFPLFSQHFSHSYIPTLHTSHFDLIFLFIDSSPIAFDKDSFCALYKFIKKCESIDSLLEAESLILSMRLLLSGECLCKHFLSDPHMSSHQCFHWKSPKFQSPLTWLKNQRSSDNLVRGRLEAHAAP